MSIPYYYEKCNRYRGRCVQIRTRDGQVHRGFITDVTRNKVYIRPLSGPRNLGGFGYGYYGWGWGGFAYGIALGFITSIALFSLFWW